MSGSDHHDWVALSSANDPACIGGIVNTNSVERDSAESQAMLEEANDVLRRVA